MNESKLLSLLRADLNFKTAEIEEKFDTNATLGLDSHEAQNRLKDNGPNVPEVSTNCGPSKAKQHSQLFLFTSNVIGVHNFPLWCGALLCFGAFLWDHYVSKLPSSNLDNLYISVGLIVFIFVFGTFSYYMDAKCRYYLESCQDLVLRQSTVVREGIFQRVNTENLVSGDLVALNQGDQVPADIKIITSSGLQILSQKPRDLEKIEENNVIVRNHYYQQLYGDFFSERHFKVGDLLFQGSFIAYGHGRGVVIRTKSYYLSGVNMLTKTKKIKKGTSTNNQKTDVVEKPCSTTSKKASSLKKQLDDFLHTMSLISLVIASTYGISNFLLGFSWLYAMMFFIAHYVGIITEALLPTFNVAKAQSAKGLAFKNCYMRNIEALETLGTVSVIMTPKTGVITEDRMIVSRLWVSDQTMASYDFVKAYKGVKLVEPVKSFVQAITFSIFAHFTVDDSNEIEKVEGDKGRSSHGTFSPFKRKAIGKPTEVALLRFMEAFTGKSIEEQQRRKNACQLEVCFDSIRKCSYKVYRKREGGFLVCLKGQPEAIIKRSGRIMTAKGAVPFSEQRKDQLLAHCNEMGAKKYRIIAIAQFTVNHGDSIESQVEYTPEGQVNLAKSLNILESEGIHAKYNFQFLGLVMLENPARMSLPEAIFTCRRAGIKVIMTTGDHPQTSLAIAQTVGIVLTGSKTGSNPNSKQQFTRIKMANDDSVEDVIFEQSTETTAFLDDNKQKNVYTGADFDKVKNHRLAAILTSSTDTVFARVSTEDKIRLVKLMREKLKKVVAVLGTGTSDLPLFKAADVRLSLGQYGSDACKANCDVLLLDDDFPSLLHGITKGRVLFENIKKSLVYTLSSKTVELFPYVFFLLFSIPKMAGPLVILAIDLITDNLPPIALGYEGAESYVMDEQPAYFVEQKVVNFETVFISLFFYGMLQFASGFFAYVVVMADSGFYLTDLIGIRRAWSNSAITDLEDSYGQEWTYKQRIELEQCAQTVYFITIVLTRIAVLFACRTRKDSCLQRPFTNSMVNFSVFFLLFFAAFFSYYSPFQYRKEKPLTSNYPIKLSWWSLGLPFFTLTLILEETRKCIIRSFPQSAIAKIIFY